MSVLKKSALLVIIILILDQVLKYWVKSTMMIGEEIHVLGDWFILHFTENRGMAFGMELGQGNSGKIFLSIFRILASIGIAWLVYDLYKKKAPQGLVLSVALIFAGAVGNIIDSAFYGLIFSESYGQVAELFPESGGYAGFLHGHVVDMFYFPLIKGHYPEWFPFWGGERFIFFRPVFNIADSAITIGVFSILIFHRNFFNQTSLGTEEEKVERAEDD